MKRVLFYILQFLAICSRIFSYRLYMTLTICAHKTQGVKFYGRPEYIQQDAYLDPSGGLTISEGVVISTKVIILTHDWSSLKRLNKAKQGVNPFKPTIIGENSFIGAGAIILPGTIIGKNCIIGAGTVVKGDIRDYSIIVGNPSKCIGDTRQ